MGGSVSPVSIMRVVVVPLHVLGALDSGNEDPEEHTGKKSFPERVVSLVPHLLIEVVDLLESLQIVLLHGCVGDSPQTKIVHVSQLSPSVLELDTTLVLDEFVLESGLSHVLGGSDHFLEVLPPGFGIAKFFHL